MNLQTPHPGPQPHHMLLVLLFCSSTTLSPLNAGSVLYFSLYTLHLTQWLKHLMIDETESLWKLSVKSCWVIGFQSYSIFVEAALIQETLGLCNLPLAKIGKWLTSTAPFPIQHQQKARRPPRGKDPGGFLPPVLGIEGRGEREVKSWGGWSNSEGWLTFAL